MKKNTSASIPIYVTALFIICLAILVGTAVSNYQNLQKLKQNNDWMEHSWSVKDHLKNINLLIMDAESSLRGYYMSEDPAYLGPWKTAKDKLSSEFIILNKLVQDNPAQVKNLTQLRLLFDRKMQKFEESSTLFKDGGLSEVVNAVKLGEGREIMDEIRLQDIIMEKEELELLTARRDRFYEEYNGALWVGNAINAVAILILILFYRLIRRSFSKQRSVEDALKLANDNLETTVLARTEQLSVLSRHLLNVSEEEKAKLARELHDEMGSSLTVISMDLSMVTEKLKKTDPAMANQLLRAKQALLDTVDLKRRIIEDLRPSMLDNLGLAASIQNHCEEITRIAGLEYEADITEDFDNIDPAWGIALFRITQESLNNVVKYAKASRVKVTLKRQPSGLWLQILDDGVGIPKDALKKPRSHGLLGMRERALLLGGSFTVKPGLANHGTAIEAFLPFPH
ncbi:MAG: CHASE3 domain-containing protein [Pseudomonadota bacterium]